MNDAIALSEILERIGPADAKAMRRAEARQMNLTKPPGSLGRLEGISVQLAGIFGVERPAIRGKAVIVAAGDHGVVAQGVTGYPQAVTVQMVRNFLAGGAAISVMARLGGVRQIVVDAGIAAARLPDQPGLRNLRIGRGTADMSRGPAMSREQAVRCLEAGAALAREVALSGADLIATGDMGIGNTTASSAIAAAMTGRPPPRQRGKAPVAAPRNCATRPPWWRGHWRSTRRTRATRSACLPRWAGSRSACSQEWCWGRPPSGGRSCSTGSSRARPLSSPTA